MAKPAAGEPRPSESRGPRAPLSLADFRQNGTDGVWAWRWDAEGRFWAVLVGKRELGHRSA